MLAAIRRGCQHESAYSVCSKCWLWRKQERSIGESRSYDRRAAASRALARKRRILSASLRPGALSTPLATSTP